MIKRINEKNINTKERADAEYSALSWDSVEYGQSHLKLDVALMTTAYPIHLDVGCCDGLWTKLMLEKFPETLGYGVDHSQVAIGRAESTCPRGVFTADDIYFLPYKDEMFDLVHCAQTIEHIERPDDHIREMFRVLKKNGELVITTPNEYAGSFKEHVWKWDLAGVKTLLPQFDWELVAQIPDYFNGANLYLRVKKL